MRSILCVMIVLGAVYANPAGSPYRLDWSADLALAGACLGLNATGSLVAGDDAPAWNGVPLDPSGVPFFDRWAMSRYSRELDDAGTVVQLAAMAVPAALAFTDKGEWLTVGVMYAQSVLLTGGLKNTLKGLFDRNRPYMYAEDPPLEHIEDGDWLNSFPSGHTAYAFNGAVFTSVVFSEYFPDSPWRVPVMAGSLGAAVATGVLRVESGCHFFSDVLAGAVLGSLTGYLVPEIHRNHCSSGVSVTPIPSGGMVTINF
ncbi:MAG: phosphatase PAP2 family protein [Candidatus Fermentibacteraceae bacterium]